MFAGPIIARELLTAPRPPRYYAARASYAGGLLIVMLTVWQVLVGWDEGNALSILSRFGAILFSFFAYLQLTLMLFFAPIAAATAVAHEKDRRTFVLLLMTDLRDIEIVVGKLVASLLQILTLLLTSLPVFCLCLLLGGVSFGQVIDVFLVTFAAGFFGGALGMIVALWRDRTFQSIALTVLLVVLFLILGEAAALILPESIWIASALSPFQAIAEAIRPRPERLVGPLGGSSLVFTGIYLAAAALIVLASIIKLRVWNPGKNEPREQREGDEEGDVEVVEQLYEVDEAESLAESARRSPATVSAVIAEQVSEARGDRPESPRIGVATAPDSSEAEPYVRRETTGLHVPRRTHRRVVRKFRPYREVWSNPILWRELRTRAYGTKPLIIKGAYVLAFALGVAAYFTSIGPGSGPWEGAKAAIPALLAVLSLILVNAQGVTALTSERDTGALDLLLVTELSPQQFIYGKLYGVLYNTKEMIVLPIALAIGIWAMGYMKLDSLIFVLINFAVLVHFSAMLGLHAAITYTNSRQAVANSLGTIFFLMLGILFCAALIIQSRQEFARQLLSFLVFIGAGSVALYGSLGAKNPSPAIGLVALLTPFWSFYCIISILQGDFGAAFLVSLAVYSFALLSMLIPAVSDFDIALGRTNAIQG
ncbi:ABC transporter permease [Tautonia rosea]|uniref:ABC transporter permease subunit n=1 Tax=Tautonia rosea TaxID=2728037 RepID=UPI0014758DF2|nr:ABC transporter permease subunit [Tautonia rosea]